MVWKVKQIDNDQYLVEFLSKETYRVLTRLEYLGYQTFLGKRQTCSVSFPYKPDGSSIPVGDDLKGEDRLKLDKKMGGGKPQGSVDSDCSGQEDDGAVEGMKHSQNVDHTDCLSEAADKVDIPEF
ncbi:hypothetical protein GUJ93_ZPchr0013g35781 [Zizania palustris]|uniref:Uncharacterized protein n=1 Tax=Zizania palustris TaxID=103762 RepID=A0A8J5X1G5_ZIZPA|nr:hypothetical protein GUJ93_ZPchr0013g35781 [Zizania palustris]